MIAATPNAQWNAARFGAVWPRTTCVTPTAEITVVRIATPAALPTWRAVLNTVDARPVAAGLIVANAAACDGTKTCAIASPTPNITARTIHRLVSKPTSVSAPITAARRPGQSVITPRGPKLA